MFQNAFSSVLCFVLAIGISIPLFLNGDSSASHLHLRVWKKRGGERISVKAELLNTHAQVLSSVRMKEPLSSEDAARLPFESSQLLWLRLRHNAEIKQIPLYPSSEGAVNLDLIWDALPDFAAIQSSHLAMLRACLAVPIALRPKELPTFKSQSPLSQNEAALATELLWEEHLKSSRKARMRELQNKIITIGNHSLRFEERVFGAADDGHSLWISLHGGGGTTAQINDRQWQNQIRLYQLEEGIYVAPRAPTNTWDLWHKSHIDPLFSRLIDNYVLCRNVNPNRVYLLGYSAGGDGVFQLAPRMADRWAAAGAMAGHPNETQPIGLRNVGFALFVGGNDSAYNRNQVAQDWKEKLENLRHKDPEGYAHWVRIYPQTGHWMNLREREALPWMARFVRNPFPDRIEWLQDNVKHNRFYWLALPEGIAKSRSQISANVNGQNVLISTEDVRQIHLRLSDRLLDLDKSISVFVNGDCVFEGIVTRSIDAIQKSLNERADVKSAASALLKLNW